MCSLPSHSLSPPRSQCMRTSECVSGRGRESEQAQGEATHTDTHMQAAVCEDRGQERFSHSNLLALSHSTFSTQFLVFFLFFYPPPFSNPSAESNLPFIWKCCSLSLDTYTQYFIYTKPSDREREGEWESKQARGRHLSSLLRELQVPKMAENKQEPRQLTKPVYGDGQTGGDMRNK